MELNDYMKLSKAYATSYRPLELAEISHGAAVAAPYRQYKILCLYTLEEICWSQCCDGELCREWGSAVLQYLDEHRELFSQYPSLREVMEDMYVKICDDLSQVALSYQEYRQAMVRIRSVREWTELQKGQMALIDSMEKEGQAWYTNMLLLAQRYLGDQRDSQPFYSGAASLFQQILLHRRTLRIPRADRDMLAQNYSSSVANLYQTALQYGRAHPATDAVKNYAPVVKKAVELLESCGRDGMNVQLAVEQLRALPGLDADMGDLPRPPADGLEELMNAHYDPDYGAHVAGAGPEAAAASRGKPAPFRYLLFAAVFAGLYFGGKSQGSSGTLLTAFLVLGALALVMSLTNFAAWLANRKPSKRS